MLKAGVNPKVVSERLGHANISITLDIYSHVLPGMQEEEEEEEEKFDKLFEAYASEMLATASQNESERWETRTPDTLIKSHGVKFPIFRTSLKLESASFLLDF
jgi:hypothetical protein